MSVIQLKKNVIEIDIQDGENVLATLVFEKTDAKKRELTIARFKLQKELEELKKREEKYSVALEKALTGVQSQKAIDTAIKNLDESEAESKAFIAKNIDAVFGEGTFDTLYTLNPSLDTVVIYFVLAMNAVAEQTAKETLATVEAKYLADA